MKEVMAPMIIPIKIEPNTSMRGFKIMSQSGIPLVLEVSIWAMEIKKPKMTMPYISSRAVTGKIVRVRGP